MATLVWKYFSAFSSTHAQRLAVLALRFVCQNLPEYRIDELFRNEYLNVVGNNYRVQT